MAAAKPPEELKRFIQSAGRREALKKTPRLRIPNQKGRLRRLRRPTRRPSHPILIIARQPDGRFAAFESSRQNNDIRLIQRGTKSPASHAWRLITQ